MRSVSERDERDMDYIRIYRWLRFISRLTLRYMICVVGGLRFLFYFFVFFRTAMSAELGSAFSIATRAKKKQTS